MNQQLVKEFLLKHNYPVDVTPGEYPAIDMVRVHLIAEELAELMLAIANENVVDIADALGDLLYVVLGAAATYGIPLQEVFNEIHKSNMTKAVRSGDDIRIREKGDGFVSPDVEKVLKENYVPSRIC